MIKPLVSKTKWSSLLAKTRTLILYFKIEYLISGLKCYRDFRETGPRLSWPPISHELVCKSDRLKGIENIVYNKLDEATFAIKKITICWFFLSSAFLQKRIRIRQFATSETMMIRQKATVPPIFNAEKFKQLQDPLDPFMLTFATYLWNCTYAVKQLWITALYIAYPVWFRTFIGNCKSPAKPQHSC